MATAIPMFGTHRGRLLQVMPVSIHGDMYFDAMLSLQVAAGSIADGPLRVRIPSHLCARPPEAGDHVRIEFLMQQVHGLEILDGPA